MKRFIAFALFLTYPAWAKTATCGIATGFPPYQFQKEGKATGLDAKIFDIISAKSKAYSFDLFQNTWTNVLASLRFSIIDCIVGIEITAEREKFLTFTKPYYSRDSVLITLESNAKVNKIEDLSQKIVGSDFHSPLEGQLKNQKGLAIRWVRVPEKSAGFMKLVQGSFDGLLLPKAVALYLSRQHQVPIKVLGSIDSVPVAVAVRKQQHKLLKVIQDILEQESETIAKIVKKYKG
ncbi:substrate-binding periplasmic protein [Pseudobacteriovorax antillogorgiicola]|uniref:Amino acid ABC transporter substrate-binding protein, PAAT family n=1 Tax=Pseudobacteriovorax antillogorgiicola TaxID=1513793 RepID=A0A1Y6BT26_9BACT|nr:transporter substrate-binding domain-containing protein [Pseudobacteriovorax antillogorgiicola]TCS53116.1 amino acid ABC transporter substrate-binding protein (PAAT family) [Pseudobacteriovorax antillogorgiicola]SMF25520.1 amino acid ABC transporter substrate-binding protein, PAAT family [Pseudobacteriovorax antillogorgiicola]